MGITRDKSTYSLLVCIWAKNFALPPRSSSFKASSKQHCSMVRIDRRSENIVYRWSPYRRFPCSRFGSTNYFHFVHSVASWRAGKKQSLCLRFTLWMQHAVFFFSRLFAEPERPVTVIDTIQIMFVSTCRVCWFIDEQGASNFTNFYYWPGHTL